MIIDYAWGRPSYSLLRPQGVSGVMRYLSHDRTKVLDHSEIAALRSRQIPFGLVFEDTANRALGGFHAGVADAQFAKSQLEALGLPHLPVYFAVDFDANDAEKPKILQYIRGAVSVLGYRGVGCYASYYVIRYLVDHDACDFYWQTYAWSGGLLWKLKAAARTTIGRKKHPAANLYQYSNGHRLAGVSCDYNKALTRDWGQSPRPAIPTPPPPPPPPDLGPVDLKRDPHIYLRAKDGSEHWEALTPKNIDYRTKQLKKRKWAEVDFVRIPNHR